MAFSNIMNWSRSSPDTASNESEETDHTSFRKIIDRYSNLDVEALLDESGWFDENGGLQASDDEEEVLRIEDENSEFYTQAYRAFQHGQHMPPRLRRSNHSLLETPFEMQEAGIELRPTQLEGAGLLCWLERMYGLGILADDMGVGKTYQLMALIFQNRPSLEHRTTLLVVPAGAISMWTANLEKFQDLKFVEYNNTYKREHFGVEQLAQQDVVLATYSLMAKQYTNYASRKRDIKLFMAGKVSRKVRITRRTWVEEKLGTQRSWAPLYGMTFHRVILDEAHRIRNVRSGQFKAMTQLQSHNRVACSGTIFNNDYTDVGAILTFLRYQPWCNPALFKRYFLKTKRRAEGRRGGEKRALLKNLREAVFKYTLDGISVRRNKRERFEGKLIVDVEKLDLRRTEHTLDGTKPYMKSRGS